MPAPRQIVKLKPDTSDSAKLTKDNVNLRCGDCFHYKGTSHPSIGALCHTQGVRPGASAPSCYTPNVTAFRSLGPTVVGQMASLVSVFSPQQSRVFMGLLKCAASLEKVGLHFMQKVYFCTGNDSLENYFSAFVMATGPEKSIMLIGRDYLKCNNSSLVALLPKSSLITSREEFDKKKAKLIAEGKIRGDNAKQAKAMAKIDYEPPTFDTDPSVLEARANKAAKRSKTDPLFSITQHR